MSHEMNICRYSRVNKYRSGFSCFCFTDIMHGSGVLHLFHLHSFVLFSFPSSSSLYWRLQVLSLSWDSDSYMAVQKISLKLSKFWNELHHQSEANPSASGEKSWVLVDQQRCHFCTSQFHTEGEVPPAKATGWEVQSLTWTLFGCRNIASAGICLPQTSSTQSFFRWRMYPHLTPITLQNSVADEKSE